MSIATFHDSMINDPLFDVLVHGLIGVDYLLQLDGIPPAGEVRVIERERRGVGGEGANCALALATWGARVCLAGNPLGTDSNGRMIERELATVPNLTLRVPFLDEFETPYSVILAAWRSSRAVLVRHQDAVDYDQQNPRSIASQTATATPLCASDEGAQNMQAVPCPAARLATCDGNLLSSTYHLARHMRTQAIPLFAQDVLLNESVAPLAEVVLLTDAFWPHHGEKPLMKMASGYADEWGNTVVITRGGHGGVWCRAGSSAQRYAPVEVGAEDLLGSVGAGDVFRAGLLWARLHNWEWERGLRFAAAAAAIKCSRADNDHAVPPMPQLDEIEAVIAS